MSLILELRDRTSHAGVPLLHPASENVVLAQVFGVIKNLAHSTAVNPWLRTVAGGTITVVDVWEFSFWERQRAPVGVHEGSTEVDLVMSSPYDLLFVEVKLDAAPSQGTTYDPERNQLLRNLDIGGRRAALEEKKFAVIYITPDANEPPIVSRIRASREAFATDCLFWSSWGMIGDVLAQSIASNSVASIERNFGLDLLAYLAKKRLWKNTLPDDPQFYKDKLYRSLKITNSPFVPYQPSNNERDDSWRIVAWTDQQEIDAFLASLRWEDKLLLKTIAEAGGAMRQKPLMDAVQFLRGKNSAALRAAKSHVNAACKGKGRMPLLSDGAGSGDQRLHEINRQLGPLRQRVIDVALRFEIPDGLS